MELGAGVSAGAAVLLAPDRGGGAPFAGAGVVDVEAAARDLMNTSSSTHSQCE